MNHKESKIQQACVRWFRYVHPTKLLFAIPNGGRRNLIEAVRMKAEGVTPGVADLFLMFGNGEHYGLFIEMKQGKGKQTEHQLGFQAYCNANKYKYVVCRSLDEFMNEINNYLK